MDELKIDPGDELVEVSRRAEVPADCLDACISCPWDGVERKSRTNKGPDSMTPADCLCHNVTADEARSTRNKDIHFVSVVETK